MEQKYITYDKLGRTCIQYPDAQAVIRRGLSFYLDEKAKWLDQYDKVSEWFANNNGKGLFLHGSSGRGKTLLAMKIFPVIFKHYIHLYDVLLVSANELNDYMKNPFDRTALKSRMPIIIDDVGVEYLTNDYGVKHDIFSELVDDAEKYGRLMILTTNFTLDEMNERYGSRTVDRLYAITKGIRFEGESLRRL